MILPRLTASFALCLIIGVMGHAPTADPGIVRQTITLDPTTSLKHWQPSAATPPGRLSLAVTDDGPPQGRPGSIEVTADFRDPEISVLSLDWSGQSVKGRCSSLRLDVWSDGTGGTLRWTIEDASGAWFEHEGPSLDWQGWRPLAVEVGRGAAWRPLLRAGETARPLLHPISLRRIGIARSGDASATVRCRISHLRAECDVGDLDLVEAQLTTGRTGGVFLSGETPTLNVNLTSRAARPLHLQCRATVTVPSASSRTGQAIRSVDLGEWALRPGGTHAERLRLPVQSYGPYDVTLAASDGSRERVWHARFAYLRTSEVPVRSVPMRRPTQSKSRFGVCGSLGGFGADLQPTIARLNRSGGVGWCRIGLSWQQTNPAPGMWAWDPLRPVSGVVGSALSVGGRTFRASHAASLDCPDEVTVAFWARLPGPTGTRQIAIRKWGTADGCNYAAYFHADTGSFRFAAGYERRPGSLLDFDSGAGAFDGRWHHYAATYSRFVRSVCLYVDGTLRTSAELDGGRLRTTTADLIVGQDMVGDLDELMVYRRALGPADIAAMARRDTPPMDGLVAWYGFDEPGRIGRNRAPGIPETPDLTPEEPDGIRTAREAASQGMATLAILGFPPAWASSRPDAERFRLYEPDMEAWAAYVEAVTRHYKDLIGHWEIWNEPNTEAFWQPQPDPERYLALLKVAYAAAKRGNPRCTVLMPGLAGPGSDPRSRTYLDRLIALGATRHCDAISIHPYRLGSPEDTDLIADLRWIRSRCLAAGQVRPIWITEMGWPTHTGGGLSERTQAAMLARAYLLAAASQLVDRFFWFRMHDSGPDRTFPDDNFGLCRDDLSPKPAFFAHRTLAVLLSDARPDGELKVGARVRALMFRSRQERFLALWHPLRPGALASSATEWLAVRARGSTLNVTDLMGNVSRIKAYRGMALVKADDWPVFVRGLPPDAKVQAGLIAFNAESLMVPTGGGAEVRVTIRNPYPEAAVIPVRIRGSAGLRLDRQSIALSAQPNGSAQLTVRVSALRADIGHAGLTVEADLPGGKIAASLPVVPQSPASSADGQNMRTSRP
jgi:hypothetical protein